MGEVAIRLGHPERPCSWFGVESGGKDDMTMALEGQLQIIVEVALALLLGGIIGFEREVADKPAGLRTHMLVSGAAALLVGLSDTMVQRFGQSFSADLVRSDPIRVIEAIISGVSFLGAGTIIRRGGSDRVEGLTTAASLLFAAGLGICVALRQFWLAIAAAVLVVATLRLLGLVQRWITSAPARGDDPT